MHSPIIDHILHNLKINMPPALTIRSLLDTHGMTVKALHGLGSLPCSCHMYHDLPKRHGHVFMPSWECYGQVGAAMLEKLVSSRSYESCDEQVLAKPINDW